jgi:hypothetical protein
MRAARNAVTVSQFGSGSGSRERFPPSRGLANARLPVRGPLRFVPLNDSGAAQVRGWIAGRAAGRIPPVS